MSPGYIDPFSAEEVPDTQGSSQPATQEALAPKCPLHIRRRKLLRRLRKFYHEIFKYHNDKIFNKRLISTPPRVILAALSQIASVYVSPDLSQEMGQFLYTFLNIKGEKEVEDWSEALSDGAKAYNCASKYRKHLYEALFQSE